jgi:hypothetical protein
MQYRADIGQRLGASQPEQGIRGLAGAFAGSRHPGGDQA